MRTSILSSLMSGACVLAWSAAAAAQQAVTTEPVSVYAGPDDSYPQVAQLDSGAPVRVNGCLGDWSWCDVTADDVRGWLYSPDLTYDYQDGYVPLYTYAPSLGIPVVQFTIGDYWDRYYHGRPWYAQRDEWEHRGPIHHRRPPGPAPSAGPPPRSARVERPSQNGNAERSLRLGRAEPSHSEPDRRDSERRPDTDRRSGDATPPQPHPAAPAVLSHPAAPPREDRPRPEAHPLAPAHEERPSNRDEPKRQEERPPTPQHAESVRHENPRPAAQKPDDRPGDSPH
jgi:uncharacterized protein YraI